MNPTTRFWIVLGGFLLVALYLCYLIIWPFVDVLMWATVLTVIIYPLHKRLLNRIKSPTLASLLAITLATIAIVVPVTVIVTTITAELTSNAMEAKSHWSLAKIEELVAPGSRIHSWASKVGFDTKNLLSVDSPASDVPDPTTMSSIVDLGTSENSAISKATPTTAPTFAGSRTSGQLHEWVKNYGRSVLQRSGKFVGGAIGFIVQLIMVLFTMFFFLKDGPAIKTAVKSYLPLQPSDAQAIFQRTKDVIYASLLGVMVIGFVQAAIGAIALWALGVPSPLLWGVAMFIASLVPTFGAALVWGPIALYLGLTGHWTQAIILVVVGGGVIGTVDNFLRPLIVGQRAKLPEIVTFFAVLGGLQVFGVLGIVMGPLIIALTFSLFETAKRISAHDRVASPLQHTSIAGDLAPIPTVATMPGVTLLPGPAVATPPSGEPTPQLPDPSAS